MGLLKSVEVCRVLLKSTEFRRGFQRASRVCKGLLRSVAVS